MADFPVTGTLPETDAIGEGAGGVQDQNQAQLMCLYIHTREEVISFLGEQPAGPPGGEEDPEEEDPDEDQPPITSTSYVVAENAGDLMMSFTRTNPRPGRSVEFNIVAEPGTASQNVNYVAPESPVTFAAGETFVQSPMTILNAHLLVGVSKTFKVRVSPPPSRLEYMRGPISYATITVNGVGA